MSSLFDSEVYAERQRLPGVTIGLSKLMQSLLWFIGYPDSGEPDKRRVVLTLEYRRDVDTSQWWTIEWDSKRAEAKELELCLFRAAVLARQDDDRAKSYAGTKS